MTEADWVAGADVRRMLEFLIGVNAVAGTPIGYRDSFPSCRGSQRKLRLFACACYHRLASHFNEGRALMAVHIAERFADGDATEADLAATHEWLRLPLAEMEPRWRLARDAERERLRPSHDGLALALQTTRPLAPQAAYYASGNAHLSLEVFEHGVADSSGSLREQQAQATLLHCIFGSKLATPEPLVPAVLSWNDATVAKLAQSIYDDRAFDRLPILADAWEEAGGDADVLAHLRHAGPHARGCWAVDLILGKV